MAKRVKHYRLTEPYVDYELLEKTILFFESKGKKKVYPYHSGQVCFMHRGVYWFVSPYSMMYSPRHRANQKWYKATSLEGVWEGLNSWLDYRDEKRKEALANVPVYRPGSEQFNSDYDMGDLCQ